MNIGCCIISASGLGSVCVVSGVGVDSNCGVKDGGNVLGGEDRDMTDPDRGDGSRGVGSCCWDASCSCIPELDTESQLIVIMSPYRSARSSFKNKVDPPTVSTMVLYATVFLLLWSIALACAELNSLVTTRP